MLALVTYPYRDRETLAVHLAGEEVELTDARFAELCAGGYVDIPAEKPAEPAAPAAEQEAATTWWATRSARPTPPLPVPGTWPWR